MSMMMSALVGPANFKARNSMKTNIQLVGIYSNCQLILDAGDGNAYSGGQTWTDVSGNASVFNRGATSGAEGSDPTFHGTAGAQSINEYFQVDGGDFFSLGSTLLQWMKDYGKAGVRSHFVVAEFPSDVQSTIFDNMAATAGTTGGRVDYSASTHGIVVDVQNTTPTVQVLTASEAVTSWPAKIMTGHSYTLDGSGNFSARYRCSMIGENPNHIAAVPQTNGSFSPAEAAADGAAPRVLGFRDGSAFATNGTKLWSLVIWNAQVAIEAMTALVMAHRGKHAF